MNREWNSVKDDKKPDHDQDCLCAIEGVGVLLSCCYYDARSNEFTPYGEAQPDGRVTHWMPLPDPPTNI